MKYTKIHWLVTILVGAIVVGAFTVLVVMGSDLWESNQKMNFLNLNCELDELLKTADLVGDANNLIGVHIAVIGALLTLIAAMFTFIAFYIQFVANKMQQEQFRIQREDIAKERFSMAKERFENKFFAMLNIYREIVQSIKINDVGEGKQAFHYMFFEFKALYVLIWKMNLLKGSHNNNELEEERRKRILKVAFNIYINGVGGVNHRIKKTCEGLISSQELNSILERVKRIQEENKDLFTGNVSYLGDYKDHKINIFDGHRLRLVSYFRQIYIIIDYLFRQSESLLSESEKDFYLQLFCSQMSEHEVGLIKAYDSSDEWVTLKDENIKRIFSVFPFHETLNWDNCDFFSK